MTKQEALDKIKELEEYIEELDEPIRFEDDKLFLLSIEEYEKYKDKIPKINIRWWLRSPGFRTIGAASINGSGDVRDLGIYVNCDDVGIRPALKYSTLKNKITESRKKDCFMWNETKWKIIDKENEIAISYLPIHFDKFDDESNDYTSSYVRNYLDNILVSHLIL